MNITTLKKLKLYDIERGPFALKELLKDSLFYPACDIDGELIRYCNMHFSHLGICSFVYVDYHTGEERLLENLNGFLGYHLFAHRVLHPADIGADKQMKMPDYINPEEYNRYQTDWKPFAHWAVLERDGEYGEEHGPKRFSLLFLGAEGVAAYAGLYLANKITPKGIAIIQPGHAFGFNWTNFFDWNAPLARTVRSGKSMPEYMFYGGYTYGYNHCPWQGYSQIDRVDHYYPTVFDSAMTVWRHYGIECNKTDNNVMNYIEYILSNASAIGATHPSFAIKDLYGPKQDKLKRIDNEVFREIYRRIWREPINREYVKRIFSNDIYKGFVTCMLWGGEGLGPGRSWDNLEKTMLCPKDQVVQKLNAVKDLLTENKLGEAFNSMASISSAKNRIPGIGMSYFTKIFYFLGLIIPENKQNPLIFDKWAQYIHAALLIDDATQNVSEWYSIYNDKYGFHVNARHPLRAYEDYILRLKQISDRQELMLSHPGVLEEFLFGRELKSKFNRNNSNPRFFVSNYVKAYYNMVNVLNKQHITTTTIKLSQLQQGSNIQNRIVTYGYKFNYEGNTYYLIVGKKKSFTYCALLTTRNKIIESFPKIKDLPIRGFCVKGKNYIYKKYKVGDEEKAISEVNCLLKDFGLK